MNTETTDATLIDAADVTVDAPAVEITATAEVAGENTKEASAKNALETTGDSAETVADAVAASVPAEKAEAIVESVKESANTQEAAKFLENLNTTLEKTQEFIAGNGPELTGYALDAYRFGKAFDVLMGVFLAVGAYSAFHFLARPSWQNVIRETDDFRAKIAAGVKKAGKHENENAFMWGVATLCSSVFTFGLAISAFDRIVDIDNWISIIDPLAGIVFQAVKGTGVV